MLSEPAIRVPSSLLPLRIEALIKRFGQVTAINGITLELPPGECLGLLGPNGAGKSTLIRSIAGRVVPDEGRVSVFGSDADSAEARMSLGWVPQDLALYPRLTCRENLESFGRYHGLSGIALHQAVAWCLDWAALVDRAGEAVKNLSGGMKRRLNMAAGMIHKPKLVLMDGWLRFKFSLLGCNCEDLQRILANGVLHAIVATRELPGRPSLGNVARGNVPVDRAGVEGARG